MKQFFVPLIMVVATSAVAAPEYKPLPIEQREAAPSSGVDYPQAGQYSTQNQPLQSSPATQPPQPNQPAVPSNVQWELYNQLQQMQQELSQLRGMVEQQAHEISQLKDQQRQRYLDLDHRLNQLKSVPDSAPAPTERASDTGSSVTGSGQTALNDKKVYNDAIALMRERKFGEAIELLEKLVANAPESGYLPNAHYWLGELYMALTPPDYETAKKHLITLLKDFKDHQKVPDALYKLGMLYNLQGEKEKSRVTLEKVIADYPDRQAAKLARQLLTQL